MKKLCLCLLLMMLTALPALAEIGLLDESILQFDLPLQEIDDVIALPDGSYLLSATCNDPALPGEWSAYVICTDRSGAVQWRHCLFSFPEYDNPFEIKIALKPEGIVCLKHDQPYHNDWCNEVRWVIGYDGVMQQANVTALLPADEVPDITNCGDFCIEMDMEYLDRRDGYPTRIFNRVTGASTAFVHQMGRCTFLPLGDKLLMFDITYDSPVQGIVFDANCQRIGEISLQVEGDMIRLNGAIETDETLYIFVNTASGGQPYRYTVIPVDKATCAVGEAMGIYTYPDRDNTNNGRVLVAGGMLELVGWQPEWDAPMRYALRYITADGSITPVDEIVLKPYDIDGLDEAFFLAIPDEQRALIFCRDAATARCILRCYGANQ